MEQMVVKSRLRPRRIIQRPRLTRILDASRARVRMLVAPAGYGKTTLAEQWTAGAGREAVWYRCRSGSSDVARLAVGLAEAAAGAVPGCDRRIRERIRATQNPPAEVDVLAEIVAEDLAAWTETTWLVIDDYHLLCETVEAERFVEVVVDRSPVQLLVASRQRPGWVTRRDLLYGRATEIDQAQLAMVEDEAGQVLDEVDPSLSAGLISLADGWPAIVGLAGVSDVNPFLDGESPKELYGFFAEEVFGYLDAPVRRGLALLALPPVLDRELAATLLGPTVDAVVTQSEELGLLTARSDRIEMHPLAQTFLASRDIEEATAEKQGALESCLAHYRDRAEWDAVLELIERHNLSGVRAPMLLEALPELLEAARITTIEAWAKCTPAEPLDRAVCDVALGEVALRQARHAQAKVYAERALNAIPEGHTLAFRALKLAGHAEHACDRERLALTYFRRAEEAAHNDAERRDARWAQLMACVALESDDAPALLDELFGSVQVDNPSELVRLSGRRICFDLMFGSIRDLGHARAAEQLIASLADPFLRCAFRGPYGFALAIGAMYEEALRVADELIADASEHKLELMLPSVYNTRAIALAGLSDFEQAHDALDEAAGRARRSSDGLAGQSAYATRMRVLAQEGRAAEAVAIEPPPLEGALPSMQAEVRASRGLVEAFLGRRAEALSAAGFARATSRGLEASTLAAAIDCAVAVSGGDANAQGRAEDLVNRAFEFGAVDTLVTCYRGSSAILELLLRLPSTRERALFAVARAGDQGLAESRGWSIASVMDPMNELSERERQICELASQGLSNGEIARSLFLSEATVKSHLHHAFEKLGVKSRHALARRHGDWSR